MKARRWILGSAIIALWIGLFLWTPREVDPLYEGKPLSQYLKSCHISGIHHGGGLQAQPTTPYLGEVHLSDAREAILKQGTNAFPMLVRMLTWGETRSDQWRRVLVPKLGLPRRFMPTNWVAEWENQTRALVAFQVLGSNAAPAARRIVPLLNDPETAFRAVVALNLIRPDREEYILSLTNVARIRKTSRPGTTPEMLLSNALLVLGTFGSKASAAIPFLINALSSTNGQVQATAAVALVQVGARPEEVVSLIAKTLPDQDSPISLSRPWTPASAFADMMAEMKLRELKLKLWALEQFGTKAQVALPKLTKLEQSPRVELREAAKHAAAKIRGEKQRD